jgi:hypothetical protein
MTDFDLIGRDMAEAEKLAVNALSDIEGIESDASGWNAGEIESAASEAASALRELAERIGEAFNALPPSA